MPWEIITMLTTSEKTANARRSVMSGKAMPTLRPTIIPATPPDVKNSGYHRLTATPSTSTQPTAEVVVQALLKVAPRAVQAHQQHDDGACGQSPHRQPAAKMIFDGLLNELGHERCPEFLPHADEEDCQQQRDSGAVEAETWNPTLVGVLAGVV
jgi:hypothetical protein